MSGSQQLLLGGSVQQAVDPFFYSVTSLLHGDGTNGGQNNTFLDSSTNNFTITRNGNTTQGSFSPFSQTGWSNYFDGTGDFLSVANNAALDLGSGDYTIEGWWYFNDTSNQALVSKYTANNGYVVQYQSGNLRMVLGLGASDQVNSFAWTPVANTWYHIAITRSGTSGRAFVNGTQIGTTLTFTTSNTAASATLQIGSTHTVSELTRGYVSNFRLVKGTAVYTANFTPPTAPLTAITNTSLLTCQANRFLDASSNNFTITRNGDVSVQPFSPFNPTTAYSTSAVGGSGYFDGSGDALTAADNAALDLGNSDFTIECWAYLTTTGSDSGMVSKWNQWGTAGTNSYLLYYSSTGNLEFLVSTGGTIGDIVLSSAATIRNAWTHIAAVRSGSNFALFANGTRLATASSSASVYDSTQLLRIGEIRSSVANFPGYLSNVRIVKGTAVYDPTQSTLTVPTAPLTAIANTQLLLSCTNGAIFDNAAVADYETVGNAQISTSVKKYGTGSLAFDGTGDYLMTNAPSTDLQGLGSGDFTVEFWLYANTVSSIQTILDWRDASTVAAYPLIAINSDGTILWSHTNNTRITSAPISASTWYHIAVCRVAGQTKMFINGSQSGSTYADSTTYLTTTGAPRIGQDRRGAPSYYLNGYIDDLRISKGIGRYPYNFTPPTAEFPNIGGTVTLTADPYFDYTTLLLPGNGTNGAQNNTFLDSSSNAFTITRNGNTTQGTFSPFSQTGWGNYFDGTGDFLTVASSTAFGLGTGDFTIEMWIYPTANPANGPGTIFDLRTGVTATACASRVDASLNLIFYNGPGNTEFNVGTVQLNTWTYVAFVRASGSLRTYVNGTLSNTTAVGGDLGSNQPCMIGNNQTAGYAWNGYQSNFRIVKGTAVYTSNFTPPTTPLTAITNTSLLTCQSNRFIDNSSNAFAITRNGDVSVQAFSPFNPTAAWSAATYGGSGYFDGSGDYVSAATASALQLTNAVAWTIEFWFYANAMSTQQFLLHGYDPNSPYTGYGIGLGTNGNPNTTLAFWDGTTWRTIATGLTPSQWYHVAISYEGSGTTGRMFLNGTQQGSAFAPASTINNTSNAIAWGAQNNNILHLNGYISGARIVKGTAVYTASFTAPTAPPTAITNTSLLLNFTNAGIYDATSKNDLETVGNAQISTTQSKFGGSSMSFDGTGDYLYRAVNPNPLGSGDWTIEFWYYQSGGSSYRAAVSTRTAADGGATATVFCGFFGNNMYYDGSTSGGINVVGSATIANSTWYHCAYVRFGSTVTMYLNGVSQGSVSDSNNKSNPDVWVGGQNTLYYLNGYIDDLRITKGIARYTSNFTPPTTAFLTL